MIEWMRNFERRNHTTWIKSLITILLLTTLITTSCSKTDTVTQRNNEKTERIRKKAKQERYLNPNLRWDDYITWNEIIPEE